MDTTCTITDMELPLMYIHNPQKGIIFRHYKKGALYIFIDLQKDSNNTELGKYLRVSYISLSDNTYYNKPFHEFNEEVEEGNLNPYNQKYKYTLVRLVNTLLFNKIKIDYIPEGV